MLRIDLETLTIGRSNRAFAQIAGSTPLQADDVIYDYATAIGSQSDDGLSAATARSNIDLTGTPFVLAEGVTFQVRGKQANGDPVISFDRRTVALSVSGSCGWLWPTDELVLAYVGAPEVAESE